MNLGKIYPAAAGEICLLLKLPEVSQDDHQRICFCAKDQRFKGASKGWFTLEPKENLKRRRKEGCWGVNRVILPMTVEEFQVGQLYSVAEASKAETGGGEGVEVLKNEPFDNVPLLDGRYSRGQYTLKYYHLQSKVPPLIRKLAPKGSFKIQEEAWNAYPYCKTVLTNPEYMKEAFYAKIETIHLPDRGTTENAHCLSPELLAKREVVFVDIANDQEYLHRTDITPETTPSQFHSEKTGRGPLVGKWMETVEPVMCAYKLVTIYFKWFGLQTIVEKFGHSQYPRLFSKFHREVFCWIDKWHGLTMADIRLIEEQVQRDLDEARRKGSVKGMVAS